MGDQLGGHPIPWIAAAAELFEAASRSQPAKIHQPAVLQLAGMERVDRRPRKAMVVEAGVAVVARRGQRELLVEPACGQRQTGTR